MPKFTKVLSVIIHKRSLLDNMFIIIFPKIFFKKKLDKYTFIQKYVLKNVCLTTLNFNYNNLVYLSYINKIDFLNVFYKDFAKASIVKCNNLFFNFFFLINIKTFFFYL